MKVRIKRGALVAQDFMVWNWPDTRAGTAADPDMEFEAEWNGTFWDCRAWGYGKMTNGVPGAYGNGSIFAFRKDGVEVLQDE